MSGVISIISIKLQYSILIFPRVLTTKTQGKKTKKIQGIQKHLKG